MLKNKKVYFLPKLCTMILLPVIFLTGFSQTNYKTVTVKKGDCEKETTGNATIFYTMDRNLYWENDRAYFQEVRVEQGQEVKTGDVLMVFETEEKLFELESLKRKLLRSQEGKVEQNVEKLEEINTAKDRLQYLEGYELQIAELKIEKLQAAYEQFLYQKDKEITQLQEQIKELSEASGQHTLTAPFDGVIDEIVKLNEGDPVENGQYLISMYSDDRLLLKADDSQGKLRYNMEVTVEAGQGDDLKIYKGKVITAPNVLPSTIGNTMTLIELDEAVLSEQLISPIKYRGITEAAYDVLYVESKAIRRDGVKEFVYLLDEDMIRKRYVKTALDTLRDVWILDGLEEGQTLIVD